MPKRKSDRQSRLSRPRPRLIAAALWSAFGAGSPAFAELPVPCAPCNVGAQAFNWTSAGSTSQYIVNGPNAVVQQALQNETFNWSQFNIGAGNSVEFRQPSSRSIALNQIFQADPSRIQGALRANGQVYLINQNGIVFGPGAQVDVNTLLASSIGLNAEISNLFEQLGLTNAVQQQRKAPLKNASGVAPGTVEVQAGAQLSAQQNGRVILVGGEVRNAGKIETSGPGGQVILAAADDEVFLFFPDDPDLRGLGVELGNGGTVENLGQILARQGNITLAGLTVNQQGVVRATSAVDVNGSIRLQARDSATTITEVLGTQTPVPSRAGNVTLTAGSVTEVIPDPDDTATAIDDQVTRPSIVRIDGENVTIGGTVRATGGTIDVQADNDPSTADVRTRGRIDVEAGAVLDTAGVAEVTVPMARNIATVEVRGNELAGSPVQRGGALFGKRVSFDVRKPLPKIANLQAGVDNVARSGKERMTPGGTITLRAFDAVDIEAGATLDVSGGAVRYEAGFLNTTKLVLEGRLVDIADADPLVRYDGVLGDLEFEHRKWGAQTTEVFSAFGPAMRGTLARFEPGYIEGKDAGRIDIEGLSTRLSGVLLANTVAGFNQYRAPGSAPGILRPYDELPSGGALKLTAINNDLLVTGDSLPFASVGMQHFDLSVGSFELRRSASLDLGPGGSLRVTSAGFATLDGLVRAQSGIVSVSSNLAAGDGNGRLRLGSDAVIDVSGGWVNDERPTQGAQQARAPRYLDGGEITLRSNGDLLLEAGSVLDVTAGAAGDEFGSLTAGSGGAVTLVSSVDRLIVAESPEVRIDSTLRAHTFLGADISRLSIAVPEVSIGGNEGGRGSFDVPLELFTEAGFGGFSLTSNERGLRVGTDVDLDIVARNLVRIPGAAAAQGTAFRSSTLPATGTPLASFTRAELLSPAFRQSTELSLRADPFLPEQSLATGNGDLLRVDAGASLAVTAGGKIGLASTTPILLGGELSARGGSIDARLNNVGDVGYDPGRAIWLESTAVLDVSATTEPAVIDDAGRVTALERYPAGTITLTASEGYVMGLEGSILNVSGTTAFVDSRVESRAAAATFTRLPVALDAGTIDIRSSNGGALFSTLLGKADDTLGAEGGTLRYTVDGDLRRNNLATAGAGANPFPETPVRVELRAAVVDFGLQAPASIPDGFMGIARFDQSQIAQGGFTTVELAARPSFSQRAPGVTADPVMQARIDLIGDVNFSVDGALLLDAPIVQSDGGRARLTAEYLAIGFSDDNFVTSDTPLPGQDEPTIKWFSPTAGTGRLVAEAGHIDLIGFTSLRGFGGPEAAGETAVSLRSAGDIRLRGVRTPIDLSRRIEGILISAADVSLHAQRLYPTTLTEFSVTHEGASGLVRMTGGGNTALPRSAGGRIAVEADRIEQLGTLMAPLGEISLDAETQLVLGSGSLTSVTSAGLLQLFGQTQIGEWVLPFNNVDRHTRVFSASPKTGISEPIPEKRIRLVADGTNGAQPTGSITLASGAVIDVRSGGDLLATEFLPGPLGAVDLLDSRLQNGSFALLPSDTGGIAAFDPLDTPSFEYGLGTRITIVNGSASGLAPGTYDVLPPRYALLPGGYLLTPAQADTAALANPSAPLASVDGRPIVTGAISRFSSGEPALVEGRFVVEDGVALGKRAEYRLTTASSFFQRQAAELQVNTPTLPGDAGILSISANAALQLGASIAADTGTGRGSLVDISAENITIRNGLTGAAGTVELDVTALAALGADSLLVGGARTVAGDVTTIERVDAAEVTLADGVALELPELLLVARDTLEIGTGASVRATGTRRTGVRGTLAVQGDNALVVASRNGLSAVQRSAIGANPDAGILIDAGASLFGAGSLIVDSTGTSTLDGTLATGPDGGLRIGAERISLGVLDGSEPGLGLDATRIQQLGIEELVIAGSTSISLFGSFDLDLASLSIDAPGLVGRSNGATVNLRASTMRLQNSLGADTADVGAAGANLNLLGRADGSSLALELGTASGRDDGADGGDFDVTGFDAFAIHALSVIGVADHVLDIEANTVNVTASFIAALSGARSAIVTSGALSTVAGDASGIPGDLARFVGGGVDLAGASLSHAGAILAPSGVATLTATGGNLVVAGRIDAAGLSELDFGLTTVGTPGGTIALQAIGGDIRLLDGAAIDVSGGTGEKSGSGGRLLATAGDGVLEIQAAADVRGRAADDVNGAKLEIDANQLFGGLGGAINRIASGEFTAAKSVRVRGAGENLTLEADERMAARFIKLSADQGDVVLRGTLDARGEVAGRIEISAGNELLMEAGASLLATASGSFRAANSTSAAPSFSDGHVGGVVTLFAPTGTLSLEGGTIDVHGTRATATGALEADASGRIQLMAARTSTSSIAAAPVAADMLGARSIEVFGHQRYTGAQGATLTSDAAAFSANAAAVRTSLGLGADTRVRVAPSAELRITGNTNFTGLGIAQTTLFNATNIAPGLLSVRTTGTLTLDTDVIDGRILDRFNRGIADSNFSWAFVLASGADLDAVDFSAVTGGSGDLVFGDGVDLMTGTGDIALHAAGDLRFGVGATVQSIGRHLDAVNFRGTISDQFTGSDAIQQTAVRRFLQGTSFPEAGGDIRIGVRGDYVATRPTQQISQWTFRIGGSNIGGAEQNAPDAWGLVLDSYRGNIGMFGGGNVGIDVGGDMFGAQISNASFGRQEGVNSYNRTSRLWTVTTNVVNELGGGSVNIDTVGSIVGLDLHLARGQALVKAGGEIADRTVGADTQSARLFLGNAQVALEAGSGISLGNVLDPNTLLLAGAPFANPQPSTRFETFYLTYTPQTSLELFSAAGDVIFRNRTPGGANLGVLGEPFANFYPGDVAAYASAGSILVDNVMNIMPTTRGTLRLVAAESVSALNAGGVVPQVFQMDTDPSLLPSLGNAFAHPTSSSAQNLNTQALLTRFLLERDARNRRIYDHATVPIHTGDSEPNVIVARDLDVSSVEFILSKPSGFIAGRDLADLALTVQNIGIRDTSLFEAGRDIIMNTPRVVNFGRIQTNSGLGIAVAGPGTAQFLAGRNIDLGTSDGIRSIGDFANPALADEGADLILFAGLAEEPAWEQFADRYFDSYAKTVELFIEIPKSVIEPVLEELPSEISSALASRPRTPGEPEGALRTKVSVTEPLFFQLPPAIRRELLLGVLFDSDGSVRSLTRDVFNNMPTFQQRNVLLGVLFDELRFGGLEELKVPLPGKSSFVSNLEPAGLRALVDSIEDSADRAIVQAMLNETLFQPKGEIRAERTNPSVQSVKGYGRGFAALDLLLPQNADGSIETALSTVQTQDGGSIQLVVPGGLIDAGLTSTAGLANNDEFKQPADLGYVAFREGNIDAFVRDDFNVNSTRVFAQQGGDITIWSSKGDIDAGRGAKSAASIPLVEPVFDELGNFVAEPPLAVNGSGIRNFAPPGVQAGSLFLFAPQGVINAGDAGIGSAGTIVLGATDVIGADNIDIGGLAVGVPTTDTGSVAAGLSGVGDVAASATKATEKATAAAAAAEAAAAADSANQSQMSIISVKVLGFGA